ncbi:MAG: hypothetical protein JWM57_409, partial [Phycisphaerales bacterium]|nr:hypothetical protein [Phycisphaerales bacterium]
MRGTRAASLLILALATAAIGAEVKTIAAPASGAWKNCTPGTYVIFRSTAWDTGAVFRRELLLGVDAAGQAVVAYAHGDQPNGPWTPTKTLARGSEDLLGQTQPLGHRTIEVAGKSLICEGVRSETSTDLNTIVTEQWTEPETGRRVLTTKTTRPKGMFAVGSVNVIEDKLAGTEDRKVGEMTVATATYDSTTHIDGALQMTRRTVVSDEVPGQRVAYTRWAGKEGQVRAAVDESVVAFGEDEAALAAVTGQSPATTRPA